MGWNKELRLYGSEKQSLRCDAVRYGQEGLEGLVESTQHTGRKKSWSESEALHRIGLFKMRRLTLFDEVHQTEEPQVSLTKTPNPPRARINPTNRGTLIYHTIGGGGCVMDLLLPASSIIGLPMRRPVVFFSLFFPISSLLGKCFFPGSPQNISLTSLPLLCHVGWVMVRDGTGESGEKKFHLSPPTQKLTSPFFLSPSHFFPFLPSFLFVVISIWSIV